ncbi:MAG: response regulator, partial [Bacillales bacterium]|nr:response regulator [Bacillales bacterium]
NKVKISFQVIDSGIGMNSEEISRLFMAFEQASSATAINYGGTGLGLSISQNLIGLMGGEIKVTSEIDVGSTFSFELSFEKNNIESEIEDIAIDNLDLKGFRLLLVEDVDINRYILIELLKDTNLIIDEAVNGQVAFETFLNKPNNYYDLIFMDIQMPICNGYEATKLIRESYKKDALTIPIIALTANAYKEDIEKAKEAGMNNHLTKPIEINKVKTALASYLLNRKKTN